MNAELDKIAARLKSLRFKVGNIVGSPGEMLAQHEHLPVEFEYRIEAHHQSPRWRIFILNSAGGVIHSVESSPGCPLEIGVAALAEAMTAARTGRTR